MLDVGGGLGILSLELLDAGFSRAVVVDASSAYLAAASEEATRRGRSASTEFMHGDFLIVASKLAPSSVVTLDRVAVLAGLEGLTDEPPPADLLRAKSPPPRRRRRFQNEAFGLRRSDS